jgi:hypothetical protein
MSTRKRFTISRVEHLIKEGRGQGCGREYKPFKTIRDYGAKGSCHRIKGWKTGRVHHFSSNLELYFFYVLEWALNVSDIREKYPLLPVEEIMEIAEHIGISYPMDRKCKEPLVMVTDFLVNHDDKLMAYSVMYETTLEKNRMLERMHIERTFWKRHGVDFAVVTENDIDKVFVHNLEWIHAHRDLSFSPGITRDKLCEIEPMLKNHIRGASQPLSKSCLELDSRLDLIEGTSEWLVKHLIAVRTWKVDMYKILDPEEPLTIL